MRKFGLLVLGIIAGFSSAALGIGGGAVMVPSLTVFFKFDIKKAIGTSLGSMGPFIFVGIIAKILSDREAIQWVMVGIVLVGAIPGAKFGAMLAKKLPKRVLAGVFGLLMVFVGLKYAGLIPIGKSTGGEGGIAQPFLICLGLLSGSASALLGIGGGVIMVPALNMFFGLQIKSAIATSLTVILPTSLAGALFHKKFDTIDIPALKWVVPAALPAAVLGVWFTDIMPDEIVKVYFGYFLLLVSIRMFLPKKTSTAAPVTAETGPEEGGGDGI